MMATTIDDYKKIYEDAKLSGDSTAMRNANDSANQIRNANGEAAQYANTDISAVANQVPRNTPTASASSSGNITDQINAMYDADLKQRLDALSSQESQITPYYANVRNSAANTQTQNQNNFNEYASANGLNVGAGGQAALSRQNVYGNAINAADVAQANAYSDIATQKSQAQYDVEMAKSQELYNELVRQQEAQQAQGQFDTQMAYKAQQDALSQQNYLTEQQGSQATAQYKQLEDSAALLASGGNFSGYQSLYGLTDAQVAQLQAAYVQQNTKSTSSSGGSKSSTPSMTLAQAKSFAEAGAFSDAVLSTLYAYGLTDADITALNPAYSTSPVQRQSAIPSIPFSQIAKQQLMYGKPTEQSLVQGVSNGTISPADFMSLMSGNGYDFSKYGK